MENPDFDKEKVLATQKALLERKRNRLDGIIQLISDVMKGVNTMSFEAFNNEDSEKIVGHMLSVMSSHHVKAIRRKLNLEKGSGIHLRCIRNFGYSFERK